MLQLTWIDDLKAEADFRAMNIPFTVKLIRFSQIDLYESSMNGARLNVQIIPSLVSDYAQGMRNGDAFPRPVAFLGKKGFILTSGNQRCNAVKELIDNGDVGGDPQISIYELQTKDKMLLEAILRAANVGHGERATLEERLAHAVYMSRSFGMATKDAAKLYVVSETAINSRIRCDRVRKDLGQAGIDTSRVPASTLDRLSKIDNDQRAFVQLGSLISTHVPTCERVEQVVKRISKAKSDGERMKIVKSLESELSEEAKEFKNRKKCRATAPKVPARPWRDKLISSMTRLADFIDFGHDGEGFGKLGELQIATQGDEKIVRELWSRIELRMTLILKKGR